MKQSSFLLLFLLALATTGWSQYDSEGENTSRFRPGAFWFYTGLNPAIPEKVRKYDRLIFDITYNDWNGDKTPFQNEWQSIGYNANFLFDVPITKKNTVSFGVGVAYSFQNIRHDQLMLIDHEDNFTRIEEPQNEIESDVTRLTGHNIGIPIEFRFRTKGWRHFKVHIGGKVGYQLGWKGKQKYSTPNGKYTYIRKDIPDIERLTYSTHLRIGIRNWALFGRYHFNPIFANTESSQLNMLQFGLSVSLF